MCEGWAKAGHAGEGEGTVGDLGREARRSARVAGGDLSAQIGGEILEVLDISEGGFKVRRGKGDLSGELQVVLYPRQQERLDLNGSVRVRVRVVRREPDAIAVAFVAPSFVVLKFILGCIGARLGVKPFVVR